MLLQPVTSTSFDQEQQQYYIAAGHAPAPPTTTPEDTVPRTFNRQLPLPVPRPTVPVQYHPPTFRAWDVSTPGAQIRPPPLPEFRRLRPRVKVNIPNLTLGISGDVESWHLTAVRKFFARVMEFTNMLHRASRNATALQSLPVNMSIISLHSAGTPFFQPIEARRMNRWLEKTKPWNTIWGPGRDPTDDDYVPHIAAHTIATRLKAYVSMSTEGMTEVDPRFPEYKKSVVLSRSGWHERVPRDRFFFMRGPEIMEVDWLYHPGDGAIPHVTAILTSNVDFDRFHLHAFELQAIVTLVAYRLLNQRHADKLIPVNIVSISDYKVRMLFALMDTYTGELHVDKSEVVNLGYEGYARSEDFVRLLCWLMATPTGAHQLID